MLWLVTASIVAAQSAAPEAAIGPGHTARIFATVGHSEWCPAGNVSVDLGTGRYAVTPTAPRRTCDEPGLERPTSEGVLPADRLGAVRSAYERALSEGIEKDSCRSGRGPGRDIIISNGGTPVLVLTTGAFTASAPDDLSCWSKAAFALHDALDEAFASHHPR